MHKVLRDRVREMVSAYWQVEAFDRRFCYQPIVPAVGGCTRTLCLLERRSMLLGTEAMPARLPPQLLLYWCRRLKTELRGESHRLQIKEPARALLTHSIAENFFCCFSKCLDQMLGVPDYARYK